MRFLVITSAPTLKTSNGFEAYAPYVNEMDLWFKNTEHITIISPSFYPTKILTKAFQNQDINHISLPYLDRVGFLRSIALLLKIPKIVFRLGTAMRKADHIHLRCPGNIGLIAIFIQILFPKKKKTVKYAGNWDPKAKQPWSYRLQKRIAGNTIVTKNCQVLVYGDWPAQSKNIKAFFTASYGKEKEKSITPRVFEKTIQFLFVGTLSEGKRPLLVIKIIEALIKKKYEVKLDIYGDGILKNELKNYVEKNKLNNYIHLHGNKNSEVIEHAYKEAHFLVLPSKSEGWPKVVAEAMFWKCVPIATSISCVPWMLGNGKRGCLIQPDLEAAVAQIELYWEAPSNYKKHAEAAAIWSRKYTLNLFETEIKKLM